MYREPSLGSSHFYLKTLLTVPNSNRNLSLAKVLVMEFGFLNLREYMSLQLVVPTSQVWDILSQEKMSQRKRLSNA